MWEAMVENMEQVRASMPPDQWVDFCRTQVLAMLQRGPQGEIVARKLFGTYVNVDELKGSSPPTPPAVEDAPKAPTPPPAPADPALDRALVEAVRHQMPALKSQAQFDAFRTAFDALRYLCNAIFEGDAASEKIAQGNLLKAVEVVRNVTEVTQKLSDVPEAATSAASEEFKRPPRQFGEQELQARLMSELDTLGELADLESWYGRTKPDRENILSPQLRNQLFDAIRAKKAALSA